MIMKSKYTFKIYKSEQHRFIFTPRTGRKSFKRCFLFTVLQKGFQNMITVQISLKRNIPFWTVY